MDAAELLRTLGRRVRARRLERGLTLGRLAAQCGLSTRFLVQVESGAGNPSVRSLTGLARALGTTPSALLGEAPDGAHGWGVIALLGLRGAGKTSVGKDLAQRLELPFVELDQRVEEAAGLTLAEVFELHGEAYYRRLERSELEALLGEGRSVVVAVGGGIVTNAGAWSLLRRKAVTVWLKAEPEEHWRRVVEQGDERPMADNPRAMAELRELLARREPLYADASHSVITSGRSIEGVVDAVMGALVNGAAAPPRRLRAPSA